MENKHVLILCQQIDYEIFRPGWRLELMRVLSCLALPAELLPGIPGITALPERIYLNASVKGSRKEPKRLAVVSSKDSCKTGFRIIVVTQVDKGLPQYFPAHCLVRHLRRLSGPGGNLQLSSMFPEKKEPFLSGLARTKKAPRPGPENPGPIDQAWIQKGE